MHDCVRQILTGFGHVDHDQFGVIGAKFLEPRSSGLLQAGQCHEGQLFILFSNSVTAMWFQRQMDNRPFGDRTIRVLQPNRPFPLIPRLQSVFGVKYSQNCWDGHLDQPL